MKGNRNFRKKVSMVTAVICTASSLPFAALADEGAGDNFNLDGTLPIVKNADEMVRLKSQPWFLRSVQCRRKIW